MIVNKLNKDKQHLLKSFKILGLRDFEIFEMLRSISSCEDVRFLPNHHYTMLKKKSFTTLDSFTNKERKHVRIESVTFKTISVDGYDLIVRDVETGDKHVLNHSTMFNCIVFYH